MRTRVSMRKKKTTSTTITTAIATTTKLFVEQLLLRNKKNRLIIQKVEEESKLQEEYLVSDIDPECITFIDCNEETNGSTTGSFNPFLNEDAEESSSSSLKTMELYNGSLPGPYSLLDDLEETGGTLNLERALSNEARKTKEEFVKFAESIAVQLAEIPDSYSRSVAKLRINQILFEAEIGVYAQTRR